MKSLLLALTLVSTCVLADTHCLKSASREWGGGSMLPTAVAMCKTAATERMRKAIKSDKCR